MTGWEAAAIVLSFFAGVPTIVFVASRVTEWFADRDSARAAMQTALDRCDTKAARSLLIMHRNAFSKDVRTDVEMWLVEREDEKGRTG